MPPKSTKLTKPSKSSELCAKKKASSAAGSALDSADVCVAGAAVIFGAASARTTTADTTGSGSSTPATDAVVECSLCSQKIIDGKDDALFCEGACKQWCHPYCAGVPLKHFQVLSTSSTPFFCFHVFSASCERELSALS